MGVSQDRGPRKMCCQCVVSFWFPLPFNRGAPHLCDFRRARTENRDAAEAERWAFSQFVEGSLFLETWQVQKAWLNHAY